MKATPGVILIGALGAAVTVAFGYAWVDNPIPAPVPAAFAAAASPARQEGGSSSSAAAADWPPGGGDSHSTIADSGTPARSWPGASSGPAAQAGAPSYQEQARQAPLVESASNGSGVTAPGASGEGALTDAGSAPLIPIPVSGQVPLAFRPLAPALSTANPQVASGLQTIQQNFVNAIRGQNQNPNDPDYAARWNAAELLSDEQYRLLVGNQNYLIEQESVVGKAGQ